MRRVFYAMRLHGWFFWRKHKRYESFGWCLEAYDRRQAIFRGEDI